MFKSSNTAESSRSQAAYNVSLTASFLKCFNTELVTASIPKLFKTERVQRSAAARIEMDRSLIKAAFSKYGCSALLLLMLVLWSIGYSTTTGQLTSSFYNLSCPRAQVIVKTVIEQELLQDSRIVASLLRLHFHDCFVTGCDGSVLLDDTDSFQGEKTSQANLNSARGFEVVDRIKAQLESACKETVSCADILAMAARESVVLAGGPSWTVLLGRRDATTANLAAANNDIPAPTSNVFQLFSKFQAKGLSVRDMVTLAGAHTIGTSGCASFSTRLYNFSGTGLPDPSLDEEFLATLQKRCPQGPNADGQLQPLDVETPTIFDNQYYKNLVAGKGLLTSDQSLYSTFSATRLLVASYSQNQNTFFTNFSTSIIKMGNINLLRSNGQIRKNCRVVNS